MRHLVRMLTLALALLAAGSALAAGTPQGGWERDSEYNKLYNPKTVELLQAKVLSIDRDLRPLPGMEAGAGCLVETAKGRKIMVHVGPIWFTQNFRDDWNVQPGDQIVVRGSVITLNGATVMMLDWGRKGEHVMTVRDKEGVPVWDVKIEGF